MPDAADPYASTVEHYVAHRPRYGDAVHRYLAGRFDLDGDARALDLGCGPGHVAIPLAERVGEVVAMDPSEPMLDGGREQAAAAGVENVRWVEGTDADLSADMGPFRVATMGRAFHRMDQERTLDRLADVLEPGGGVALLNDVDWLFRGTRDWQALVHETVREYVPDLPERTGPQEYDTPWSELLREEGYEDVETLTLEFRREWDADGVVGYVLSLSTCPPAEFGDDLDAFEADLRERLAAVDGAFTQDAKRVVVSGRPGE